MPLTAASQARWASQAEARLGELKLTIPKASTLCGFSARWLRPRLTGAKEIEETEAAQVLDRLGLLRYPPSLCAHYHPDHPPRRVSQQMPTQHLDLDQPFPGPPAHHTYDEATTMLIAQQLRDPLTELCVALAGLPGSSQAIVEHSTQATRASGELALTIHVHVRPGPKENP